MSGLSMADFVARLRADMEGDFQAVELEGFHIAMKIIQKWADHDGADWEALAEQLQETAVGVTNAGMAYGYNAATTALQGAVIAFEYVGAIE